MAEYQWIQSLNPLIIKSYISIDKIRARFKMYENPYSVSLPVDAYINNDYKCYNEPFINKLVEAGKEIYWANPYNADLDTYTTFMLFYIEDEDIIPLLIVEPPYEYIRRNKEWKINSGISYKSTSKLTKKQRHKIKRRLKQEGYLNNKKKRKRR